MLWFEVSACLIDTFHGHFLLANHRRVAITTHRMGVQVFAIFDCQHLIQLAECLWHVGDNDILILQRCQLSLHRLDIHMRHSWNLKIQAHVLLCIRESQHDISPLVDSTFAELQEVRDNLQSWSERFAHEPERDCSTQFLAFDLSAILVDFFFLLWSSRANETFVLYPYSWREGKLYWELAESRYLARERRYRDWLFGRLHCF
mmetsp:Transcript_46444/g.73366  ORF Transcript_46444/g.73366 Transcript_46444/m.73366 type:complete len:203 (-) Transcript_46444:903-1511(-)